MDSSAVLPPLPKSDPQALQSNQHDSYYGVRAREFWQDNQLIREELKPFVKCEHFFEAVSEGVQCQKCHAGYRGLVEIYNGQLIPPKGRAL